MVKEKTKAGDQKKISTRDIFLAAAAVAIILVAGLVIYRVIRSDQPNITYQPSHGLSAKAQWVKEQKDAKSAP